MQRIPCGVLRRDDALVQGADDPYVNGTCQELLKWKFAHMNSVDFLLLIESGARGSLLLGLHAAQAISSSQKLCSC